MFDSNKLSRLKVCLPEQGIRLLKMLCSILVKANQMEYTYNELLMFVMFVFHGICDCTNRII